MALKAKATFINKTPQLQREVTKSIGQMVEKAGFMMERDIKDTARNSFEQQTGNLRRSIRYVPGTDLFEAEIGVNPIREGADVNYAIFLEYGTRYIAPRAFMYKGAKRAEIKIRKLFAKKLGEVRISGTIKKP